MKSTLAIASLAFGMRVIAHPGHGHDVPGYAAEVYDSPPGLAAAAEFVSTEDSMISGRVIAAADPIGSGTVYHFTIFGMPAGQGPFGFHIHEDVVPESGNCSEAGGHFDPFGRGSDFPCASSMPDSCEVGDLSGKYGMVAGDMILSGFLDMYTSMNPNNVAFVGNRSLILHNYAGERIACANFKPLKLSPDQTCVEDPLPSEEEGEAEEEPVEGETDQEEPVEDVEGEEEVVEEETEEEAVPVEGDEEGDPHGEHGMGSVE